MWEPQPGPQSSALLADWCEELFYGGERGGGKSDFQLGYQEDGAIQHGPAWRGIIFRKTYPELEELQSRASEIFPGTGAVYKTQPSSAYPFSNCWYWPFGGSCKMRFIEHERDYGRYHGHQYTGISFDEVTEYATPAGLLKMLSTLRSPHGVRCTVRLTGNPGGIGHAWVKARYVDVGPPMVPYADPDTGFVRMFIRSQTSDNAILLSADPDYRNRIKAATGGNEALRKAWLEGDWNIVAGAFFDNWDNRRHVIEPFTIPETWMRFRSADWGSARPFSVGWWAVASDDYKHGSLTLPRGCMVRYREWYGMARDAFGQPHYNTGLKLTAEQVGDGIAQREKEKVQYGVLDPAAFSRDGGPSIAERMLIGCGVNFRRADNARVPLRGSMGGWDQMRQRLDGEAPDRPMIVCFPSCTDSIRTVPMQQHDPDRIEDIDTDGEDHCFAAGTQVQTDCGPENIEDLPETGIVASVNGYAPYRSARLVKSNASVVRITFADGYGVTCTPDHKFLVGIDEWRYASDLLGSEVICIQSSSAPPSSNLSTSTTTCAESTFKTRVADYIGMSGWPRMGQFLSGIMSITRTKTGAIMHWATSNALHPWSTWGNVMGLPPVSALWAIWPKHALQPLHGTQAKPVGDGILSTLTQPSDQLWSAEYPQPVSSALAPTLSVPPESRRANSAQTHVKRARCVSVVKLSDRADVYCITVPTTGCFALAGGMIVANCADEWRYACMSRPWAKITEVQKKPKFDTDLTINQLIERQKRKMRENE